MKLNVGCGNIPLIGYINIDKYYYPGSPNPLTDHKLASTWNDDHCESSWSYGDAANLKEFQSNVFNEVIMVHCLEHLSMDDGNIAIKEASRVLKPGGILEIEVPDLSKACWLFNTTPLESSEWLRVMGLIYGTTGVDGEGQFHLTGYSKERLSQMMGLHDIENITEIPVGFGHGRPEPEYDFRLKGVKKW